MSGGVGGGASDGPAYPIPSAEFLRSVWESVAVCFAVMLGLI